MYWLLLCLWLAWSGPAIAGEIIEEIAAKVNDEIVTKSDLEGSRDTLRRELQRQFPGEPRQLEAAFAERNKDLLRDLIDRLLLQQRGKEMNVNVDIDVIKRLDQYRKKNGFKTMEELEQAISAQGMNFEDFKANVKRQLVSQQVIGNEVSSRVKITQDQIKQYYEEHKHEYDQPEQVQVREILISTEGKEGAELEAAEKRAREVLEKVRTNGNFAKLAQEYSDGATAKSRGGDIGFFRRGQLAKQIEEVAFRLNKGETSDLIRTKYGWLIIKVELKHEGGIPQLSAVESKVREVLFMQGVQPEMRKFLARLRKQAYITVKPGYLDTGAPANPDYARLTPRDITEDELIAPRDRLGKRSWFPPWRRKKPKKDE